MRFTRFRLRTAFLLLGYIALLIAIAADYVTSGGAQQLNVALLERIAGDSPTQYGETVSKVSVWYDNDLKWNESEHRFQLRLLSFEDGRPPQLQAHHGRFSEWISKTFGRDFAHVPVAVEIDCYDFESSTFDMELFSQIIRQIEKLPTVKQVWIRERANLEGETRNEMTNQELAKQFPDLIIASPQ